MCRSRSSLLPLILSTDEGETADVCLASPHMETHSNNFGPPVLGPWSGQDQGKYKQQRRTLHANQNARINQGANTHASLAISPGARRTSHPNQNTRHQPYICQLTGYISSSSAEGTQIKTHHSAACISCIHAPAETEAEYSHPRASNADTFLQKQKQTIPKPLCQLTAKRSVAGARGPSAVKANKRFRQRRKRTDA